MRLASKSAADSRLLKNLRVLRVHDSSFKSFPSSLYTFENLVEINLVSSHITIQQLDFYRLTGLQTLIMSYQDIASCPQEIGTLIHLKMLDLSNNKISSLPESFSNLVSLEVCNLHSNQIEKLPEDIGNLAKLISLDLSCNIMTSLPASFVKLASIGVLHLNNNQIKELPADIGRLKSLKSLTLKHNNLRSLPHSVGDLSLIEQINVSENNLTSLASWIGKLENLRCLNASENPLLSYISESIRNCRAIILLNLAGTCFVELPLIYPEYHERSQVMLCLTPKHYVPVSYRRFSRRQLKSQSGPTEPMRYHLFHSGLHKSTILSFGEGFPDDEILMSLKAQCQHMLRACLSWPRALF